MPLIMIVSAFAALIGYGGSPRASIFMGRKQQDEAERTLGNCFTMQIVISVLLTVALLIWNRDFLLAFGASENTIEYGTDYMNPVSYTHLDVYKRQTQRIAFFVMQRIWRTRLRLRSRQVPSATIKVASASPEHR